MRRQSLHSWRIGWAVASVKWELEDLSPRSCIPSSTRETGWSPVARPDNYLAKVRRNVNTLTVSKII